MLVIEGHESSTAGRHTFRNIALGTATAGQTTFTATLTLPTGESFDEGNTAINPRYFTVYVNGVNRFHAAPGDPLPTNPFGGVTRFNLNGATGVLTLTLAQGASVGDVYTTYTEFPITFESTERHIFPADRCTWTQLNDPQGGYLIDDAYFWDGTTTGGTTIDNPRLGFIGKSGRFVEIAG